MRTLILAAAASLLTWGSVAAQELVMARGGVASGAVREAVLWFRFQRDQKRFEIDLAANPDPRRVIAVVQAAADGKGSLVVRFDPRSGVFLPADPDVPTYRVRELAYGDLKAVGEGAPTAPPRPEGPRADLALGMALAPGQRFEAAKAAFDRAHAGELPEALKALAYRERGHLLQDRAYLVAATPTPDADALLISALGDFRAWRMLRPKDVEAAQAVASALSDLGAYDEALAIYDSLDEAHWSGIRIGAIHRLRGDYVRALAALDEIVGRQGPQNGMAWRYHRGWTLADMGRHAEAVSEFTLGLGNQPDYSWALFRRACSLAQLSRLPEALADQQRALDLRRASLADMESTPALVHDTARAEAILAGLKAAVASGRADSSELTCGGYWGATADRRPRSPLLPAD